MARVRQNQRTASFCCFLQKMISQENTVGVKKNRLVPHLPRMLDIRRFTKSSFSPHEDRPA